MSSLCSAKRAFVSFAIYLLLWVSSVSAIERPGELPAEVGIFSRLGEKIAVDTALTNYDRRKFKISDLLLDGKPLIIVPVYYRCPRLCGLLLDGVFELLTNLPLEIERDFRLLAISFNPQESVEDARIMSLKYNLKGNGVYFAVGDAADVVVLMDQLGFKYKLDGKDFAHSAGVMILTPKGEISQLFTGIQFSPWDVKLALVEASRGSIGTAVDHLLLYCFRFDPLAGRYTWAVNGLLKIGGVLTLIMLAGVYYWFVFRKGRVLS